MEGVELINARIRFMVVKIKPNKVRPLEEFHQQTVINVRLFLQK